MCTMYALQLRAVELIWDETVDVLSQLGVVLGICASHGFTKTRDGYEIVFKQARCTR